jgi:hypothetical protein
LPLIKKIEITNVIEANESDEDFVLLMKLCLKEEIIRPHRVRHYMDTFKNNREMCKYYELLHDHRGHWLDWMKYMKYIGKSGNKWGWMSSWWCRTIFVILDTGIVLGCVLLIDSDMIGIFWNRINNFRRCHLAVSALGRDVCVHG